MGYDEKPRGLKAPPTPSAGTTGKANVDAKASIAPPLIETGRSILSFNVVFPP